MLIFPVRTAIAGLATLSLLVACKGQGGIGYVDSSRVVKEAARFQSARDSLKNYNERWRAEAQGLDSLVKGLASEVTSQTRRGPALDSLLARYNSKQHDLQRFIQASTEKARRMEEELMAPHLKTTNTCLQKFLTAHKLTVLLGTQQAGTILAGDPSADYTERAVEYLNKDCKE